MKRCIVNVKLNYKETNNKFKFSILTYDLFLFLEYNFNNLELHVKLKL